MKYLKMNRERLARSFRHVKGSSSLRVRPSGQGLLGLSACVLNLGDGSVVMVVGLMDVRRHE